MSTAGVTIKHARYDDMSSSGLYVEFNLWSPYRQTEDLYRVQMGYSNIEGSFVKKWTMAASPNEDSFETLYSGGIDDAITFLENVLTKEGYYHWTYLAFVRYVAGWCDAVRMVKAKSIV